MEKLKGANRDGKATQDPTGGIVHPLGRFASTGLISRGPVGSNGQTERRVSMMLVRAVQGTKIEAETVGARAVFFETFWGVAYV